MHSEKALTVVEPPAIATLYGTDDPQVIVQKARAKAVALADVVRERGLASNIQGKDYVHVEGWTFLGSMCGVFPVTVWTRPIAKGWEARVEARTLGGEIVGGAEAECTRDEKAWADRPDYALRSMAQTRATSKALRMPLGYIMTLAGYSATPYEEVAGLGNLNRPAAQPDSPHYCQEHKTEWFKRGRMQRYAHPIEGTDKWCNMPEAKSVSAQGNIRDITEEEPEDIVFPEPESNADGSVTKAVNELLELREKAGISVKNFQERCKTDYGTTDLFKITGEQRAELTRRLEKIIAEKAG